MATSLLTKCGTKARFVIVQLSSKNTMSMHSTASRAVFMLYKQCNINLMGSQRYYSGDSSSNNNNNNNGNVNGDSTITSNQPGTTPIASTINLVNTDKSKPAAEKFQQKIAIKEIPDSEIKKSVFISQSYDIYTNLALEDWFYRNFDFTNHHVLMLWSNDPCVVVGRHQNPFSEANISNLTKVGIELARRNSGGGTVYHDRGNMNLTFFTPRERYNRTYNLNIVTRALFREWGIKAEISKRDDIVIDDKKVSGTAAKLGQPNAYHHCTLLVNSDKNSLKEALVKDEAEIVSKATTSVRSPIKNLTDVNRHVNIPQLLSAIGYEFLRTSATELHDGGRHLMMKQNGFQLINPTEKWFPGLMEIREQFASWDWRFGKTPKFTVQKDLQLKSNDEDYAVQVKILVDGGIIEDISLALPNCESIPVVTTLKGKPYSEENLHTILNSLKTVSTDNVKQAMNSL